MSLNLVDKGSISKPGPIGRLLRLGLGLACIYGLWELFKIAPYFIEQPLELLPNLALMILLVLCVFNYVVNIGFSKDWKFYPTLISVIVLGVVAGANLIICGTASSSLLGVLIIIWMSYFYAHLGISFVLAATLATPGCEMRAIPELFGKVINREVKEHHCPFTIILAIDSWEKNRRRNRRH